MFLATATPALVVLGGWAVAALRAAWMALRLGLFAVLVCAAWLGSIEADRSGLARPDGPQSKVGSGGGPSGVLPCLPSCRHWADNQPQHLSECSNNLKRDECVHPAMQEEAARHARPSDSVSELSETIDFGDIGDSW